MTAQVIFLNRKYYPTNEQLWEMAKIQHFINEARAGMNNRIAGMHASMQMIERQRFHQYFRDKIKGVEKPETELLKTTLG